MTRKTRAVVLLSLLAACPLAEPLLASPAESQSAGQTGRQAQAPRMTNADVLALVAAGLSEDFVLEQIAATKSRNFDVSVEAIVRLKEAGVAEPVIRAMAGLESDGRPAGPSSAPASRPRSAGPAATASRPRPGMPTDIGVYVETSSGYMDVDPEPVNWRTGGFLRTLVTAGILRGKVNAWLNFATSSLAVPATLELLVITPEGAVASEYRLLRLDAKPDRREFQTVSATIAGSTSGIQKNQIPFQSRKLQSQTYRIALGNLSPGEYGLLAPVGPLITGMPTGKIYSFTVK